MKQKMRAPAATLLLMLFCPGIVLAQNSVPNSPPVSFPSVTQPLPRPLLSASGRFSSLSPPNKVNCRMSVASGRVASTRLIRVSNFDCNDTGERGFRGCCSLMNVEFSDPADAAKMVAGRQVSIRGRFTSAYEDHGSYPVHYLIVQGATIQSSDPEDGPPNPALAGPSFMICQPQEMDTLANKLGRELCVQSSLLADLDVTSPVIEVAAGTAAQNSLGNAASGDPAAISCRLDPEHTDAHLQSAVACARNRYWAWWAVKQRNPRSFSQPAPQ
jgi:hypothetical protein